MARRSVLPEYGSAAGAEQNTDPHGCVNEPHSAVPAPLRPFDYVEAASAPRKRQDQPQIHHGQFAELDAHNYPSRKKTTVSETRFRLRPLEQGSTEKDSSCMGGRHRSVLRLVPVHDVSRTGTGSVERRAGNQLPRFHPHHLIGCPSSDRLMVKFPPPPPRRLRSTGH